jgi:hypothetical protein
MASRYISGETVTKTRTIWMYAPSRVDGPRGRRTRARGSLRVWRS